jgi:hypothetical protein
LGRPGAKCRQRTDCERGSLIQLQKNHASNRLN